LEVEGGKFTSRQLLNQQLSTCTCNILSLTLDFPVASLRLASAFFMELNNDEIRRYSRHLILPEVGMAGQKKICSTSVLCIGAGGLGSPITMYLAAAGIGKIGVLDFDVVDFSNLQRQIAHGTSDVGRPKTESARDTIKSINPNVEVVIHNERISAENALDIIRPYDIVVDGTDNFPTRYLTNDACVLLKKANVYGSIFRFEGQASVFAPHLGGPCYAVCIPSRRRRAWCRAARKAACSACCRALLAAFRPRKF
jgi:molybdopterin/thiamine biosynthesis adenylyltransferase